jgi:hypothetical protein
MRRRIPMMFPGVRQIGKRYDSGSNLISRAAAGDRVIYR